MVNAPDGDSSSSLATQHPGPRACSCIDISECKLVYRYASPGGIVIINAWKEERTRNDEDKGGQQDLKGTG